MLPEHNKNYSNGRNNQENIKKIILDPVQKFPVINKSNDAIIAITTTPTTEITTDINFQTAFNSNRNNSPDSDSHITALGGSTPKRNHFTVKHKITPVSTGNGGGNIKLSSSSLLSINRKKLRQRFRRRSNHRTTTTTSATIKHFLSFQDNLTENHYRRGRRINGLQLPLHPLQVFGWIILILFGIVAFTLLIPTFQIDIQQPLYGLLGGLYIVHIVSHLTALLIDPADNELRRIHRNDRIVPEFDRSKHSHVIENGRCHLCNIKTTSNRTKHCSVCNKCVGKFDHHCKWLNQCIGGRNYVAFLMCVVSAVIATLVILAAAIAQIVLFYINPQWLNLWYLPATTLTPTTNDYFANESIKLVNFTNTTNGTNDILLPTTSSNDLLTNLIDDTLGIFSNQTADDENDNDTKNLTSIIAEAIVTQITNNDTNDAKQFVKNPSVTTKHANDNKNTVIGGISLHDTIFLIFTGFLGVLAAITAGLLLHLCFFHIYISFLGLTTYEYIRNHRQNAAAANLPTTAQTPSSSSLSSMPTNYPNSNSSQLFTSKRNSQIFICSSLNHPNNIAHLNVSNPESSTTLHCCENSREYQTSLKAIYMCSLLEESTSTTTTPTSTTAQYFYNGNRGNQNSKLDNINESNPRTFHCCSQFKKNPLQINDDTVQHQRATTTAILHFSEQCTFCTFRIKAPIKSETTMQDKRCCLKTITKHHRWRRKWNCCSTTPDSPDVPNDIVSAISTIPHNNSNSNNIYQEQHQQQHKQFNNRLLNTNDHNQMPIHFIKTDNDNRQQQQQQQQHPQLPRINLKSSRPKLVRPWPVTRFRHMLRMIGRYRRPRCRHGGGVGIGIGDGNIAGVYPSGAVKQNQIRPIPNATNLYHQCQMKNSSADNSGSDTFGSNTTKHSIETILPTSVIRDGNIVHQTNELTMPVLPPPARKKLPSPTNLDELAETLGFSHIPSVQQQQQQQKLLNSNTAHRRPRRKNLLRTRSPTLSPIHESGLSNPTSPQPCRHVTSSCAATIVNNSCGTSGTSIIISSDGLNSDHRN